MADSDTGSCSGSSSVYDSGSCSGSCSVYDSGSCSGSCFVFSSVYDSVSGSVSGSCSGSSSVYDSGSCSVSGSGSCSVSCSVYDSGSCSVSGDNIVICNTAAFEGEPSNEKASLSLPLPSATMNATELPLDQPGLLIISCNIDLSSGVC